MNPQTAHSQKPIEIVAGRFVVRLPDAAAAHDFLEEADRREKQATVIEHVAPPSPIVSSPQPKAEHPASAQMSVHARGLADAKLVAEVLERSPDGVIGADLGRELFGSQRHRLSNVIKFLRRRCKRVGMDLSAAVKIVPHGRASLLMAGPELRAVLAQKEGLFGRSDVTHPEIPIFAGGEEEELTTIP